MKTKICGVCKQEKPITEFYTHKRDGYQSGCKSCKRIEGRKYSKSPARRAYNRKVYERLKANGYFKDYEQKPEVKQRRNAQQREYANNPRVRIRFLARWYARRMTENGTIKQQPCALCGDVNSERHHPNYNEPLLIVWLCAKCHQELHNKLKAEGSSLEGGG